MDEYNFPEDCQYTEEDEWVRDEGQRVRVGITDYAQCQLGDVVFVELPEVGTTLSRGASFGTIESVKAVSDLFAPLAGVIVEVNEKLVEAPEKINESCYGEGWILVVEPEDPSDVTSLMGAAAYREHVDGRDH